MKTRTTESRILANKGVSFQAKGKIKFDKQSFKKSHRSHGKAVIDEQLQEMEQSEELDQLEALEAELMAEYDMEYGPECDMGMDYDTDYDMDWSNYDHAMNQETFPKPNFNQPSPRFDKWIDN